MVTETFTAGGFSTLDRRNLVVLHFEHNHFLHALEAEVVVAAG